MANYGIGSINDFRKRISIIYDLISTNYHESGHVVYGLLCLMKIDSVEVFQDKKLKRIHGFTYYTSPNLKDISNKNELERVIYNEIGLSYAGLVAEKHNFKLTSGSNKFPSFLKNGSSDDTMEASELIRKYNMAPPGRERYAFKKKIIKEVEEVLHKHWDAVMIVAHALFEKKELNFLELKDLLTKKTKNKKFWKEQFKKIS